MYDDFLFILTHLTDPYFLTEVVPYWIALAVGFAISLRRLH